MASRKTARVIDRLRVSVDAEDFALASAAHDDASLCGYVRLAWWLHVSRYEGALAMAIHKVIEVLSQSEKSWEDATQRAVKDAGKCIQNQTGNLSKFGQTACKELAGSFASECVDDYKDEAKFGNELVKAAVEDESADCEEDLAFDFFDICMFGF
jgi:hypothetical protein